MIVPPEPRGRRRAARRLPASAMLRRLSWGVADQAVSSLTNVVVGLYVARTLGPVDFGAFSLAYVTYAFLLNASRGVATDPLVVRHSGSPDASWRTAASRSAGTATVVGVVGGAACLFAAVLLGTDGATGAAFLALGVTIPGLLLQDAWRFVFFSCGRGGQALLNDAMWGTTLLVCLTLVTAGGQADVLSVTLIWGFTGTVAALFGAVQVRSLPRPTQCLRWVLDNRDLAPRYLAENLSMSGAAQLRMYGVGALAGLTAVGAVRGAEVLMGPFFVLLYGLSAVAVPEAVRVRKRASHDLLRFCLSLGALMAAAAACWGAVLLLLMPLGPGEWLLGDVWALSSALLVPATLAVVNASFSVGASAGLRALAAARRSLRAQLVGAAAYFVGGITGAALGGAVGSAWGVAAATFVGAVVWWWHFRCGIAEGVVPSRHEGSINPTISSGRTS